MKFYPKYILFLTLFSTVFLLTGCHSSDKVGAQARTDLTSDHIRGLYSGMDRNDIEDLLGSSDKSLAEHESIEVYSLADGTTALLRYRDDRLMGAYLRDREQNETPLFGYSNTESHSHESSSSTTDNNSVEESSSTTDHNSTEESSSSSNESESTN